MLKRFHRAVALLAVVVLVMGAVPAGAESVDEIIQKAQSGNAQAQAQLGYMYCLLGADNRNNLREEWYQEAVKWYLKSAAQGFSPAQEALGDMYSDGVGVRQDYAEAVKWYRMAAENKNTPSHRVSEVIDKLQVAQIYLEAANEYPSQLQTQQAAYDVPNLLDFGSDVLRFIKKGANNDIYRYYNYRCNIGYDGGIAERFVNEITSAYPFVIIKHYFRKSKYRNLGDTEIWALRYTGNKQARTYRRTFGKNNDVYMCHVTISKSRGYKDSFVTFSVGVSNELSYGGDTSGSGGAYAHSHETSSGSASFGSSIQPTVSRISCTRCFGDGKIKCDRCENGYIYSGRVDRPSFTGVQPSHLREYRKCDKCGGSGKMECDVCHGDGYKEIRY